jgi:hypothetical protein
MASVSLEDRVKALEEEVTRLKAELKRGAKPKQAWWDQIAGTFANDPLYEKAMRLGREYRESLRPKPRKQKKR